MAADPDLEWTATILDVKPQVILHDRLMTDAALGTAPIKSEHSYSLTSDGDSIPDSPLSLENKMDGKRDVTELWLAGTARLGRSTTALGALSFSSETVVLAAITAFRTAQEYDATWLL
jgi:hypothetical protein